MIDTNKTGYVYLLASKTAGTTYLGVTSDLIKRIAEHKAGTSINESISKDMGVEYKTRRRHAGLDPASIARDSEHES